MTIRKMLERGGFTVLLLAALVLATGALLAAEPAAQDRTPEAVVSRTTDRMLAALRVEGEALREDPEKLSALVRAIVEPHMDFEAIAGRVLGKHWREASPAQRERFIAEFRTLLLRTYATALTDYAGVRPSYGEARVSEDGKAAAVRADMARSGKPPIAIEYRMHKRDGEWKGVDIAIDGISLVVNYRSSFAQQVRSHGLDGLIERIAERNRSLGSS